MLFHLTKRRRMFRPKVQATDARSRGVDVFDSPGGSLWFVCITGREMFPARFVKGQYLVSTRFCPPARVRWQHFCAYLAVHADAPDIHLMRQMGRPLYSLVHQLQLISMHYMQMHPQRAQRQFADRASHRFDGEVYLATLLPASLHVRIATSNFFNMQIIRTSNMPQCASKDSPKLLVSVLQHRTSSIPAPGSQLASS